MVGIDGYLGDDDDSIWVPAVIVDSYPNTQVTLLNIVKPYRCCDEPGCVDLDVTVTITVLFHCCCLPLTNDTIPITLVWTLLCVTLFVRYSAVDEQTYLLTPWQFIVSCCWVDCCWYWFDNSLLFTVVVYWCVLRVGDVPCFACGALTRCLLDDLNATIEFCYLLLTRSVCACCLFVVNCAVNWWLCNCGGINCWTLPIWTNLNLFNEPCCEPDTAVGGERVTLLLTLPYLVYWLTGYSLLTTQICSALNSIAVVELLALLGRPQWWRWTLLVPGDIVRWHYCR